MISKENAEALQRLTKGKYKLSKAQIVLLASELRAATEQEIIQAAFPPKLKRERKSAPPKPQWLKDMQTAQKRVSWKAADARDRLLELASNRGFEVSGKKPASFPKAAEAIAAKLGGDQTRDMFVGWVDDYTATHKMV